MIKLATLIAIALEGGREVMTVYGTEFLAKTKADASPVTEADLRCERVILDRLAEAAPGIPVVAEEAVAAGRVPESGETFFLVDPLDGTKEFVKRNGDFTVNIALVEAGVPVAGVVYAPAAGQLWTGSRDEGAFRADVANHLAGDLEPIRTRKAPPALIAVGSRSHGSAETAEWLSRLAVEHFVSRGSSLKFCILASGEADIYPRLGRTMEWDTAAGDAVLRAAGGIVTTLDGAPLSYNKRGQSDDADFANPHFVAYGDPRLAQR
ncbi:3'(2'),5'-bisphosphate nucleotidase CysQ [Aurantimonas sp. VKM B-3413]|uniref:3'(2'),5'-bisphosphate nucleotidase CysQ n=1 Tax=Aurantimonas sp. VKM B-3413 TaxID=2779401 RepID=UPI00210270A2|nr:3'(2'),5'-bisphosphate nucleotidase CysQ [Aurantimonas sp. VKM B-3413]MCB8839114.1 3'(2'),5'-bisphosphate nucleotidase CysQ [Aurantimonas sp. VKM B-3413]